MSAQIIPFTFNRHEVRVIDKDGEPWFIAKDVAEVLGYSNPRDAVSRHCKASISGGVVFRDAIGREQNMTIIPEKDVYRLILRSNLPQAEAFEELVVGKILPTIRKTGRYGDTPPVSASPSLSREARLQFRQCLWLANQLKLDGNQAILSANRATKTLTGVDMMGIMGVTALPAPQAEVLLNATDIGRQLGEYSARDVNELLIRFGYQTMFRDRKGNLVYEPTEQGRAAGGVMQDTGKKHGSGVPIRQLRWSSGIIDRLRTNLEGSAA